MATKPGTLDWLVPLFAREDSIRLSGLRELSEHCPNSFIGWARAALRSCHDTSEARQIISMLATRGWLTSLIREAAAVDPGWAGALAQLGQTIYSGLDHELATPEQPGKPWPPVSQDPASLAVVLDLLVKLQRMLPPAEPPPGMSPQMRARLALGCGGMFHARRLLDALLRDEDPRVRANAVEALWVDPPREYLPILRALSRDLAHRVAANALVGLLLAGEEEALNALVGMVEQNQGVARLAAIWAMGRTGDLRFHAFLKQWRLRNRNETAALRGSLSAMVRLRQAEALSRARRTGIAIVGTDTSGAEFVIRAVVPETGPELRGAHIQPWSGDQPVWSYRAAWEPAPPDCRLLLVLPAGAPRQDWERNWSQLQRDFPDAEAAFDPGGIDRNWTHIIRLGGQDAPPAKLPGLTPDTRILDLPPSAAANPAEALGLLRSILSGVWAIRLSGVEDLTLRVRSPRWAAGPVPAAPGASA